MLLSAAQKSSFVVLISFLLIVPVPLTASDLTPDDVVAKHLQSLGSAQARASIKSRVVEGTATYKLLVGGSGQLVGKAGFASEGRKVRMVLKFNDPKYSGEQFIYDGERTSVAGTYADKSMTRLPDRCPRNLSGDIWFVNENPSRSNLADYDVYQFAGHDDDLRHVLARDSRANFLVGQSPFTQDIFRGIRRHHTAAAHLAIDLHGNFDFFFLRQRRIVFRPRRSEQAGLLT